MIRTVQDTVNEMVRIATSGSLSELRIEIPSIDRGDVAICITPLAKVLKQPIATIGEPLKATLEALPFVASVMSTGPYLNLRFRPEALFTHAIESIHRKSVRVERPERIMVEYLSPNTNKPLHLGHVRNGVLGSTLANLLTAVGHDVIRAELINDRGEHICKSMLAYKLFGENATPASSGRKSDHFVGDWYVRFATEEAVDPTIKERVHEMLRLWEAGDADVMALWRLMNGWVYEGFGVTNERYGFRFDKVYYESGLYMLGKDMVTKGLGLGIFITDEKGAIRFPLPIKTYGTNPEGGQRQTKVLNADGTSVYMTQDIGTAIRKADEFKLDRSIYVVANEQDHHFRALFAILQALGYDWANRCFHLSYAMVELPDGKMKSRQGTVVDADNLADEMVAIATALILEREPQLDPYEVGRRAETIALAAIKFYLLKYSVTSTIHFDRARSIAFEGDTGPYCLYAYARAMSILERAQAAGIQADSASEALALMTSDEERACAMALLRFPDDVRVAAESYTPSLLAERILDLAKAFNKFYKNHKVMDVEGGLSQSRLALVEAVAEALRWGFSLMGVTPLSKM